MVIVLLFNNTELQGINANDVPNATACHFVGTFSSLPSLAQHCTAGASDGWILEKKTYNLLRTSNSFSNSENVGNSKHSDPNAFVSRVQGVFVS